MYRRYVHYYIMYVSVYIFSKRIISIFKFLDNQLFFCISWLSDVCMVIIEYFLKNNIKFDEILEFVIPFFKRVITTFKMDRNVLSHMENFENKYQWT